MLPTIVSMIKRAMCCSVCRNYNHGTEQTPAQQTTITLLTPEMLTTLIKKDCHCD